MTINYFEIIFCKLYQWVKFLHADDLPHYTALCIYALLVSLNISSLFGYGYYFIKGMPLNIFSKLYGLYLILAVIGLLYLYFIQNRRYIKMCRYYSKTVLNRGSTSILAIVYILGSILLFVSLVWLK